MAMPAWLIDKDLLWICARTIRDKNWIAGNCTPAVHDFGLIRRPGYAESGVAVRLIEKWARLTPHQRHQANLPIRSAAQPQFGAIAGKAGAAAPLLKVSLLPLGEIEESPRPHLRQKNVKWTIAVGKERDELAVR